MREIGRGTWASAPARKTGFPICEKLEHTGAETFVRDVDLLRPRRGCTMLEFDPAY